MEQDSQKESQTENQPPQLLLKKVKKKELTCM